MYINDLSVYTKNQSTNMILSRSIILESIDIPQPHPDCRILYVMGDKEENPAHKF